MRVRELSRSDAETFFVRLYRGKHHFPSPLRGENGHYTMRHYGSLATFDYDELTRLVLLAHELGVRAYLNASGPRHIKIAITARERGFEPDIALIHPTIDEAVAKFRERDGAQWTTIMSEKRREAEARKE